MDSEFDFTRLEGNLYADLVAVFEETTGISTSATELGRQLLNDRVVSVLEDLAIEYLKKEQGRTRETFSDSLWRRICSSDLLGWENEEEIPGILDALGYRDPASPRPHTDILLFGMASCARALASMDSDEALLHLTSASHYGGIVRGMELQLSERSGGEGQAALTALGLLGADARHKENRALKADVFDWCDAHMQSFQGSMDDAAISIAEKLVPLKFRAVRAHMTQWKRLRSTGTR